MNKCLPDSDDKSRNISASELQSRCGVSDDKAFLRSFNSWSSMLVRTICVASRDAKYYSERGIRVCERWLNFENFIADMGGRPEGVTLDRIDFNGDYEPSNCRWATPLEQARNRRSVRRSVVDGVHIIHADAARIAGVHPATILRRIESGVSGTELLKRRITRRNEKLTQNQVREIKARLAARETTTGIARDYGVTHQMISNISTGKAWREVQL